MQQETTGVIDDITKEAATQKLVQGWLQILGPTTTSALATILNLEPAAIFQAFLAMEMQGLLMRGTFEYPAPEPNADHEIEWCERRILQRIHRRTVATLRKADRASHSRGLFTLAAPVAASRPANSAIWRRRRLRSPPPARRFRGSCHRVGAHSTAGPRRQLRSSLARRPMPLRSRRLGPDLTPSSLVIRGG